MNKLLKYTSLLFLGFLMLATPEKAFAANEKVETEVYNVVQTRFTDSTDYTEAKRLKASVAQYTQTRNRIKKDFEDNKKKYEELREQLRETCSGSFMQRLTAETQKSVEAITEAWDSYDAAQKEKWEKILGVKITNPKSMLDAAKASIKASWKEVKLGYTAVSEPLLGLWNTLWGSSTAQSIEDALKEFVADTLSPGFSFVYNADHIINKCTFGSNIPTSQFDELRNTAAKAEQAANELDGMPENVDEKNLYVYSVYAGKDENGIDRYNNFFVLVGEDGVVRSLTGAMQGCIPLQAKLAEAKSCIFCPLFKTIFSAANKMATSSYQVLGLALAKVLLVGFAILIAFKVMGNVSSFTKQDAPKFITELLVNMFKVLVAFLMLKDASIVYDYIIGPVLKAGFEFGTSLLFHKTDSYLSSCKPSIEGTQNGIMPTYLYTNLDCFIKAVQAEVAIPQSIGSTLMCVARNTGKSSLSIMRNVLWDFGMMFQGLVVWIMGWIMALAFAFYLIDATIQLGILGALMPFLIACWPFKVTNGYTKKGWEIFMNTFFVYVFMGLVVSINVELLGQALAGPKGGFQEVMRALNANDVKSLTKLLDIGFSGLLVLIACALFAFKLTGKATDLASSMSGGFNLGIGNKVGGLAANVATRATQGTAKLGMKAGGAALEGMGVTPLLRKGRDKVVDTALKLTIGRRRRSAAAVGAGAAAGAGAAVAAGAAVKSIPTPPPSSDDIVAQSQVKKINQSGPRQQPPVVPNPETPGSGGRAGETQQTHSESRTPQSDAQLRQQLENDYNNTANGKAGQQMIQNQTAEVTNKKKAETDAQNKMNHHNRRAEEYMKKAEGTGDVAQKQKFEELANQQFEEAVKAEAEYNKAKADTQRAQAELNSIQQENDRYKEQYIQTAMRNRSSGGNGNSGGTGGTRR